MLNCVIIWDDGFPDVACDCHVYEHASRNYHAGNDKPHYPVPAIIYRAEMDMSYRGSYYIFNYSQYSIGLLVRVLKTN